MNCLVYSPLVHSLTFTDDDEEISVSGLLDESSEVVMAGATPRVEVGMGDD